LVIGDIRLLHVLKGKKPSFSSIHYSNGWCGGLRLDVGHYFVAATSRSGTVLELDAYDQSVVDISASYHEDLADPIGNSEHLLEIKKALRGQPLSRSVFDNRTIYYSQTIPAPPP